MQVQSIQTTNDCRKPCFKMQMLNDPRGHYVRLWSKESKDQVFRNTLKSFIEQHKGDVLEIIDVVYGVRDEKYRLATSYRVINHSTGGSDRILVFMGPQLRKLYEGIMESKQLFEVDDSITDLYKQSIVQPGALNTKV